MYITKPIFGIWNLEFVFQFYKKNFILNFFDFGGIDSVKIAIFTKICQKSTQDLYETYKMDKNQIGVGRKRKLPFFEKYFKNPQNL